MASIPKMLVITPILQISKIPVLICHTIICSLTLLCLCGNVPHKTVGELPEHNHNVTVSTSGNHAHTFTFVKEYDAGGTEPGSASWRSNQGTKTTEQAGTHTHTVTISNTGSNYHTITCSLIYLFIVGVEQHSSLSGNCLRMGITLRVLLQANTLTLYQSTTHIILIFSPTKIYFREVKINQELVQNQQTFQAAIPTSLLLLKPVAILPIITYNLI